MTTNLVRLLLCGLGLVLLAGGVSAATIPPAGSWVDRGLVIDTGPHGQAWDVLMEGISPCAIIRRGSTFYLYYVGSPDYIDDPANVGPKDRAIGVATSTDLVRWTKHAGNPVIEWTLAGNPEEGAPSAGVHLGPSGEVVAYFGANTSNSPTSPLVWADVRLATSTDGLSFVDQGIVVNHSNSSVYGSGDEIHGTIAFETGGTWYAYYVPNGTPQQGTLGVAYGPSRGSLSSSTRVSSGGGSVRSRGPASIVPLGSGNVAFFVGFASAMDVRTTTTADLTQLSAPVVTYAGLPGFGRVVYLDSERRTWFMLYNAWTHVGLMIAPDGAPDATPPTAPPGASATAVRYDTVDVAWSEASDAETGVLEYRVYRDGVLLATTRGVSYRDTGLEELTPYTYEIRAVNLHGTEGPPSAAAETTPADAAAPVVAAVTAGAGKVKVVFDERVDEASAETPGNYQVAIPGRLVSVLSASLGADQRTVTLTTSSQANNAYATLIATGVADRAAAANRGTSSRSYTYSLPGLVGYWRLDETAETTPGTDTSGSGNHGVLWGTPAGATGRIGGALTFDGVDDYVAIEDTAVLDGAVSSSFTFAGWARPASVPPATRTGNWAYTLFKGPNVRVHYDQDGRFSARTETTEGPRELLSATFAPGSWHHVAMVVDNAARKLHLYVDRNPVAGSPLSLPADLAPAPIGEQGNWPEFYGGYRIGATSPGYEGDGDRNMFKGQIDDVRLYNRALSAAAIAKLFTLRVPPAAPSQLAASAVSPTGIRVTWQDNSTDELRFKLQRRQGMTAAFSEVASLGANTTEFIDSSLSPSTEYFYRLRATNSAGASAYSNEAGATTLPPSSPPPPVPPAAPTGLSAVAASSTEILLGWTDNASNESGFKIERRLGTSTKVSLVATVASNVVSFRDTGLAASTQYVYRVRATNAAGDSAFSNEANASTPPSSSPPPTFSAVNVDLAFDAGPVTYRATGFIGITLISSETPREATYVALKPQLTTWVQDYSSVAIAEQYGFKYQLKLYAPGTIPSTVTGDWSEWESYVATQAQTAKTNGYRTVEFDIWNEPDCCGYWPYGDVSSSFDDERYYQMWIRAYRKIKSIDPDFTIVGPSIAYQLDWLKSRFLPRVRAENAMPDVLSWHHIGSTNVSQTVSSMRAFLANNGYSISRISINEYGSTNDATKPGFAVQYMHEIEKAGVESASRACWQEGGDWNCTRHMGNVLAYDFVNRRYPTDFKRSVYWAYKSYAEMTGRLAGVSVSNGIVAVASTDAATRMGYVLLGNVGPSTSFSVSLNAVDVAPFYRVGFPVHVTIQRIPNTEANALPAPITIQQSAIDPVNNSIVLTFTGVGPYDAYFVRLSDS